MKKTTVPDTSRDAYEQKLPTIESDWGKILKALAIIQTGNYCKIATFSGLDKNAVGRRLKELELQGKVYKPGSKSLTYSSRQAYDYCLVKEGVEIPKIKKEVTYKKKEKSAADFASELIKSTKKKISTTVTNPLFD